MTDHDVPSDLLLDAAALRSLIEATIHPGGGDLHSVEDETPGAVGLEVEFFPVRADGSRLDATALTSLLDTFPGARRDGLLRSGSPPEVSRSAVSRSEVWHTRSGGRLVPEPGAQLEYASPPFQNLGAARSDLSRTLQDLTAHAASRGVTMLSAGMDPLGGHAEQSLTGSRYPAMHTYFGRRSPHGHQMMTGTASIQVNLDLGSRACADDRWRTAQLVAPLATATFANSPVPGAVNGRAAVWRSLDPTRTGIPKLFCDGEDDPVEVLVGAAREADVMLFRRNGHGITGEPDFSFGRWFDEGHPLHGFPTIADAGVHLSTLFPEVRTRASLGNSFVEIRSIDALPAEWRIVPAVLYCGLLYDAEARAVAQQVMEPHRAELPDLLDRASRLGLWDPQLCAMAVEVWTAAASAARRLGPAVVDPADVTVAERYLDAFTMRGRAPSDVLRRCGEQGRDAVLANCAEPLLLTGGSR